MKNEKMNENHKRKSIRLKEYDYSSAGAYFVTICTKNHKYMFGKIVDGEMKLNDAGLMVEKWYYELENKFPDIKCDEFKCMPNHIHFIVINMEIVQWFKTMTTNEYIKNVKNNKWAPFYKKLWQRNYYEHIIRNEKDLNRIRKYIIENPVKWEFDKYNPVRDE